MSTLVANQTFWYGNRFFVRDETLVDSSDPVVAGTAPSSRHGPAVVVG